MRSSYSETISKQEVYKLKVSIVGLFNASIRNIWRWDCFIKGFENHNLGETVSLVRRVLLGQPNGIYFLLISQIKMSILRVKRPI